MDERINRLEQSLAELRATVADMRAEMNRAGEKSRLLLKAAQSGNPLKILEILQQL